MAITQNLYTGNGSTTNYSFTFPYLETTDIKVSLDGVATTAYSFANATTLQFNTAPGNGVSIRIYRDTDDESLSATFYPGSAIRAQDLNDNFTQNLYVTQEVNNNAVTTDGANPMVGPLNMNGFQIDNLATPTSDTDAVNRAYVNDIVANGIGDGDKGDIVVSGSGTTFTVDSGAITNSKVNANAGIVSSKLAFTQAGTGAVQRTVESKLQDGVSVKDFGAVGDGVTDDTAAIQAATAASSEIYFPAGTYKVNTTVSIGSTVAFADGAVLKPASGQTVTLSKAIKAGRHKIFDTSLGGSFAVTRRESVGYPEWFGAVIDSSPNAATNLAAIQNTVAVFGECNFAGGDYFISDTLDITSSFKRLKGNFDGVGSNTANGQTRLVVTSATADVVHVFTTGLPADKSTWISNVRIEDLQLARNTPPQMSATSKGSAAGARAECVAWFRMTGVFCAQHIIGVYLAKTIRTYLRSVHVLRISSAASHPIDNHCIGFWIDGSSRISGFVSGNASCYMYDCSLTIESGLDLLDDTLSTVSIGLYGEDTASDLFVEDFEVARCKTGITFNMSAVTDPDTKLKGMQDVHIRNMILDVISKYGVAIQNLTSPAHIVRLDGGYISLTTNTAGDSPIGIYELSTYGQVTATNVQIIGRGAGGNGTGISVQTGRNGYYRDNTIIDCAKPFVQLGGRHVTFESSIINTSGYPASQAALTATNASRCVYRPTIDGDSAVFPKGVEFLGSPQNLLEVATTNIVTTAISGGTSNMLLWKGVARTVSNAGLLTDGSDNLVHIGHIG